MSNAKICDFCKDPIDEADEYHVINIDRLDKDCCKLCWNSSVILSEMRRTRTRKVVKKAGRPKGKISAILPASGHINYLPNEEKPH